MRKKSLLLAMMMGAAALTAAACSEDTNSSNEETEHKYAMSCSHPGCMIELYALEDGACMPDRACSATIGIDLNEILNNGASQVAVNNVPVQVNQNGNSFSISQNGTPWTNNTQILTDNNGQIRLFVQAVAAGTGSITFQLPAAYGGSSLNFNINVVKPMVVNSYNITVNASYSGGAATLNRGFVTKIANTTCDQLIKKDPTTGAVKMTSRDVEEISGRDLDAPTIVFVNNQGTKILEDIPESSDTYAIFVSNSSYEFYGCDDGINKSKNVANVVMAAAEVVPPGPVIVDDGKINYMGVYDVTSSFNALSLLPHADLSALGRGTTMHGQPIPYFKDMLAGDWVEFALDFLSNPTGGISDVLINQLLPLLLDADWLKKVLAKVVGLDPEADISGIVTELLKTFKASEALENLLNGFLGDIKWYDTTTSIISVVNNLATEFTLNGKFYVMNASLEEDAAKPGAQILPSVLHSYDTLLYNNGKFSKCVIGEDYKLNNKAVTDVNNNKICKIKLADLRYDTVDEKAGVFSGRFISEVREADNRADIRQHPINIIYGQLIYGAIKLALPKITGEADVKSLGDLLAYYVGQGIVTWWNKSEQKKADEATAEEPYTPVIISDKVGCDAVGAVVHEWLKGKLGAFGNFVTEGVISNFCGMGVNSLDDLIENQINKLASTSNKIIFSSDNCELVYGNNLSGVKNKLISFGNVADQNKWWGSTVDTRCKWRVAVGGSNKSIEGKFFAINSTK
jgi:hypothetical protein